MHFHRLLPILSRPQADEMRLTHMADAQAAVGGMEGALQVRDSHYYSVAYMFEV